MNTTKINQINQFIEQHNMPVGFKIGRGGRYYNGGHKTFLGETDINAYTGELFLHDDGEYYDETGNPVGLTEAEAMTGCGEIDRDGMYNTIVVKPLGDCTSDELQIIAESQNYDGYYVQQLKQLLNQ